MGLTPVPTCFRARWFAERQMRPMGQTSEVKPVSLGGFFWLDRPKRLGRFVLYCGPRHIVKVAKKEMAMPTTRSSAIDLAYRPETYFWAHDKKITLSSDLFLMD